MLAQIVPFVNTTAELVGGVWIASNRRRAACDVSKWRTAAWFAGCRWWRSVGPWGDERSESGPRGGAPPPLTPMPRSGA